ncbi:isocitrate lyase/phosphoenolpyruvate mutase family protein [Chelatococcus sp. SYSU_G07232]|uniref:Isocitrate lyase/phosphoenolpyruvate mutase family protein n=1 Tax=Chelatococcus albus TaxID=3047466 RepID=A0ABT7AMM2_9HYPH|nr:isocitrate lyase/phosphoenolpyruvate mutase family protein [Chelatococcus sp. SYSU_G07232]MDJ1160207.1 isocitrate lyase/phosphoenolpyruvate mutase family protein [Chelatococcus sp. SYSU_G07232]
MSTIHDRRRTFRKLHEGPGAFVIPNPWNVGTTRYLQHLGFKALATTSAGIAFQDGLPDANWAVPRDVMLAHIREIVEATDLPVNADFESGYAHEPEDLAANVRLCLDTGVAGLTIEDATGDRNRPLYQEAFAAERIAAARSAIDASATGVLLTARTDLAVGGDPRRFDDALRRLVAYAEAGADCVYAPTGATADEIRTLVAAVAPKPVSVIVSPAVGLNVRDYEALGVKRVSGGSALCRLAWGAFMAAAGAVASGSFAAYATAVPFEEINEFFRADLARGRRPLP